MPSKKHDEVASSWGCYCFMPVKAMLVDATCWAWENDISVGWEEELNYHE